MIPIAMAAIQKPRKALRSVIVLGIFGLVSMIASDGYFLYGSLPMLDGRITLKGLAAPVNVKFDGRGIRRIEARTVWSNFDGRTSRSWNDDRDAGKGGPSTLPRRI